MTFSANQRTYIGLVLTDLALTGLILAGLALYSHKISNHLTSAAPS
jgi:hypothetical protein